MYIFLHPKLHWFSYIRINYSQVVKKKKKTYPPLDMYFGLLVAKIATRGFYTPNASVKINIKVWLLNIKVNIKVQKRWKRENELIG